MTTVGHEQRAESADSGGRTDRSDGVTENAVFEALGNVRRRYVLRALSEEEKPIEIGPLAERVAARENETTPGNISSAQRKSTYTSLHQLHLPKLEELGFLTYDRQSGEVHPTSTLVAVEPHLCDEADGFPWSRYYLGLSVAMGTLVSLAWLGVFPFSVIAHVGWAALTIGILALSAVVHCCKERNA